MAPGPAMSGKATGTTLAPLVGPSFLIISRPNTISNAKMKSTKAPATANEAESMLNNRSNPSPTK